MPDFKRSLAAGSLLLAATLAGCAAYPCDEPGMACGPPPVVYAPAAPPVVYVPPSYGYASPDYAPPGYAAPGYPAYAAPAYADPGYGGPIGYAGGDPAVFAWGGESLPILYDGGYGWGGWDHLHRWHPAPPDARLRLSRDFPGGRGWRSGGGFGGGGFAGPGRGPAGFQGGGFQGGGFRPGGPGGQPGVPGGYGPFTHPVSPGGPARGPGGFQGGGLRPGGQPGGGYGPFTHPVSPGGPGPARAPGAPGGPAGYGPFTHPER